MDLSFVTHIFLINALLDNSLEQQVVSRAYRMGATRSVIVEQIYTNATIEEHLYHIKNDHNNNRSSSIGSTNKKRKNNSVKLSIATHSQSNNSNRQQQ